MRRLLALPLLAGALAFGAPAHAETCTPGNQVWFCAGSTCVEVCYVDDVYVEGHCEHPVPERYCAIVEFRAGGH
jgi:hypothetical protein